MGAIKNLVTDILADIDEGLLTFEQIAVKHDVSLREVNDLALDSAEEAAFYHDELERDHDEPYEPEYPDPDSWYEEQYDLGDY